VAILITGGDALLVRAEPELVPISLTGQALGANGLPGHQIAPIRPRDRISLRVSIGAVRRSHGPAASRQLL